MCVSPLALIISIFHSVAPGTINKHRTRFNEGEKRRTVEDIAIDAGEGNVRTSLALPEIVPCCCE